jgi:hypothetical protein
MEVAGFNVSYLVTIVVGLLLIWLVFRVLRGAIRLVITLAIIALIAYLVLNVLR